MRLWGAWREQIVLPRTNGSLVDKANALHEVADSAIRRLEPEQQARFRRMRVATPVRR